MSEVNRREFLLSAAALAAGAMAMEDTVTNAKRPAATQPPNVLWLMTDEQRRDSLGCYGSPWARTPTLDALAGQGVLFRRALTPSPVCVPARVSILTGRYPAAVGVTDNPHRTPDAERFLTEVFVQHGYQTAGIGKQHYNSPRQAFQFQVNRMIGDAVGYFEYLKGRNHEDYNAVRYPNDPYHWIFAGRFPEETENMPSYMNVTDALAWCDQRDPNRPFLLRVSFNDPHTPVVAPDPYDTMIDPDEIDLPGPEELPASAPVWEREGMVPISDATPLTMDQRRRMRQCYYGLVSFVDGQIQRLLDGMRLRGLLDNTIIVYVSDHGTLMGDYGLVQKQVYYEPVVCVPYFFHWPGQIAAGVTLERPVETLSLLPTLLDLCGLPLPDHLHGRSLAGALRAGSEPAARPAFSEQNLVSWDHRPDQRLITIRDGRWRMTVYRQPDAPAGTPCPDGALYNLETDPTEIHNLYDDPQYAGVVADLLKQIEARDRLLTKEYKSTIKAY